MFDVILLVLSTIFTAAVGWECGVMAERYRVKQALRELARDSFERGDAAEGERLRGLAEGL